MVCCIVKKRWSRKATGGRLTRSHADRLTKHVKRTTLPKRVVRNYGKMGSNIITKYICDIPVYEDGRGFAFGAWLEEGRIGCLSWMSESTPKACEAVLREAKASRAAGLYLPGTGHVPDFPVGEWDLMVEIPIEELHGGNLRCVLFDVLRPQFSESSEAALPIRIEFEPRKGYDSGQELYRKSKVPLIQPDDFFRIDPTGWSDPFLSKTKKVLCADRRAKVSTSARGIRLTFDKPIVMFAPFKYGKQRTRIGLGVRGDRDQKVEALDWPIKFLAVDVFEWDHGDCMSMFEETKKDVESEMPHGIDVKTSDGEDEDLGRPNWKDILGYSSDEEEEPWKGYTGFRLHSRILVLRGIYLPAPKFAREKYYIRWGNMQPSDEEYESLYGKFSVEAVAARVIQRAWRRVSYNPYDTIGDRVLRTRAALHVAGS